MSHISVQLTLADCPVPRVSGLQPWDPEFHSIGGMAKKKKNSLDMAGQRH